MRGQANWGVALNVSLVITSTIVPQTDNRSIRHPLGGNSARPSAGRIRAVPVRSAGHTKRAGQVWL